MTEVWKDITGYEGKYQVSNLGNIRSLYKERCLFGRNNLHISKISNMTPTHVTNGYLKVILRINNKRKSFFVHRLVAEAFIENPNGYEIVNHIDYNKENNSFENLEWCTQRQNIHHSLDNMQKPKFVCKKTNTGHKYIRKTDNAYRVCIKTKNIKYDRTFKTLDDAISERDTFLNEINYTR